MTKSTLKVVSHNTQASLFTESRDLMQAIKLAHQSFFNIRIVNRDNTQ
jgi:hypothetical protein